MAPAASITDVWEPRASHGALAVRLVQVTPAADAREPGRWHRTQPRACGRAINTTNRRCATRVRTAPKRTRALATRARARAKTQSDGIAQKHAHALTPARVDGNARKHPCARTQRARTQMNTQLHTLIARTRTCSRTHSRAHAHTPKYPVEDPTVPRYPCRTTRALRDTKSVPRRHRDGTALVPRCYRARALPSTR